MNGKRWDYSLLIKRYLEGWRFQDIAEEQGMSPFGNSVGQVIRKLRKQGYVLPKRRAGRPTGSRSDNLDSSPAT